MKTHRSLVSLLLLTLAVSTPCRANLLIERLVVSAYTAAVREDRTGATSGSDQDSNLDVNLIPDGPFDLPSEVTATVTTPHLGLALQTKSGFFRNFASFSAGFLEPETNRVNSDSGFFLVVGTVISNAPLLVDFHFLGAKISGIAYYGEGEARAEVEQTITFSHGNDTNIAWRIHATVELQGGVWTNRFSSTDRNNIGIPGRVLTPHDYEGGEFTTGLELEVDAFHGILDFGLLQPGETFTLKYEAIAKVDGTLPRGGSMQALLVDPFTIGGPPPAQVSLQGLALPATLVPELRLSIALVDNAHARITWPTNAAGYALQFAPDLPAQKWYTVTDTPTVVGDRFELIVDTTAGSRFYQLR